MDKEGLRQHRAFKKDLLDVIFSHFETFYLHCMPHPNLVLGKRGLLEKEKSEGIILVFGPHSNRNLGWDEHFLYCELQFQRWETVQIPYESIARIFDKEGQIIIHSATMAEPEKSGGLISLHRRNTESDATDTGAKSGPREPLKEQQKDTNVIHFDFGNKEDA
ncbi:MAG: stringent starvation protein B [Leptospiraceae bacterium]|nr:stringent starvation protein B [Leptospiraceae bacterium]